MSKKRMILLAVLLLALVAVLVCWLLWWSGHRDRGTVAATAQTEAEQQETKTEESKAGGTGTGEGKAEAPKPTESGTGEKKDENTQVGETKTEETVPEKTEEAPAGGAETAPGEEAEEVTVVYTVGAEVSTRVVTAFTYENTEEGWGFAVTTEGDEPMASLHYREDGEEKERSFPADEELWDRVLFLVQGGTLVRAAGEGPVESTLRWEGMTPADEGLRFRPDPEKQDALTEIFEDMKTMEAW